MNHIFHFALLFVGIIIGGSAATAFKALGDLPSPIKTTWRMEVTCLAQLLPFIYEFKTDRERSMQLFSQYIYLPIAGGVSLSLSLLFWVLSLEETSVAHSVLIANSVPLVLVVGNLLLCQKVKTSNIAGVGLGVIGLFIISLDIKSADSTMRGDVIAGLSTLCTALYWVIGNEGLKNKNLPLWSYMITLNAVTCLMCYGYSVILYSYYDFFGWVRMDRVVYVLLLGLGPGTVTHASLNYLLKYLGPLIVTSFGNLGPFVSITIAWIFGYQRAPELLIWVGGSIVLSGNMVLTIYKNPPQKHLEMIESVLQEFIDSSVLESMHKTQKSKEILNQPLCATTDNQPIPNSILNSDTKQDQEPEIIEF